MSRMNIEFYKDIGQKKLFTVSRYRTVFFFPGCYSCVLERGMPVKLFFVVVRFSVFILKGLKSSFLYIGVRKGFSMARGIGRLSVIGDTSPTPFC